MPNSNPHSYQNLLAAGVPWWQIRDAINSGLNPNQLPPEYFGMRGGFTPQSVGPGATPIPSGVGGIDFPPATGPGSNPSYGYGDSPAGGITATGYPGMYGGNAGSMSPMGGNPMGFNTGVTPDWENLPSYGDYQSTPYDSYGGMNYGGNDISGFGGDTSLGGYLPPYTDSMMGFAGTDTGGTSVQMPQDTSQSPADVFAGLQDPTGTFSEPGALQGDIPIPEGFGELTQPPPIPDVPADTSVWSDTHPSGPMSPYDPNFAYGAPSTTGTPFGSSPGAFQAGTYVPSGHSIGTNYGAMGYSLAGVPGTYVTTPSGQTYSTAVGMFGNLDAGGGGYMPVGSFGGPASTGARMMVGEGGDSIGMFKHGLSTDLNQPEPGMPDLQQFISSYIWQHNPGQGSMGSGGPHGWYAPIYSPGTGTNAPAPTSKPGK